MSAATVVIDALSANCTAVHKCNAGYAHHVNFLIISTPLHHFPLYILLSDHMEGGVPVE